MSFYKEVPGRQTTLESTLKFDTTPIAGSTNPVTSGGVAEKVSQQSSNFAPEYAKQVYTANSYVMHDGILYTNPDAIETAEAWTPAHWTQTTVAEMIACPPSEKALIGGRYYKTVKIGSQIWLAENIDYKFTGCEIGAEGSPSTAAAWYYSNDETTYGIDGTRKCGLLYNWYAVKALNDAKDTLCPGWHVPTNDEWIALANTVGGASTAGTKLKALDYAAGDNWPSGWNGADDYGFAALPAGIRYSGSFTHLGSRAYFWTANEFSSSLAYFRYLTSGASMDSNYNDKTGAYSVRLVKD